MTGKTGEIQPRRFRTQQPGGFGPRVEDTIWGFVIAEDTGDDMARRLTAAVARFFGAILIMASIGVFLLPSAAEGSEMIGIKMAVMVIFAVLGGYLVWAGSRQVRLEFQVDTVRDELRVGSRDRRGVFQRKSTLAFADIASVFLLRSKDPRQPTRLFVRVAGNNEALELGEGDEPRLEALRDRLARSLTRQPATATAKSRPRPRLRIAA